MKRVLYLDSPIMVTTFSRSDKRYLAAREEGVKRSAGARAGFVQALVLC